MSNTFKKCAIFSVTAVWLVLCRMLMGAVNLSDNVNDWVFSALVQIVGMGVVPLVLFKVLIKDESLVEGFSLRVRINPIVYLIAVVLGVFLRVFIVSFSILWQNVAFLTGYTPVNSAGTVYSGPEVLVMSIFCSAVLPGCFEELTYRGLGTSMLKDVRDERAVILIVGLLFGLGHQFILQTGYAFLAGMVFAFLAIKTKSILPGAIAHFLNNFFSVIGEYSSQKNGVYHAVTSAFESVVFKSFGTVALTMAFSGAVVVALLYAVKKIVGEQQKKKATSDETYYFPNTSQYVDDLFGKNFTGELRGSDGRRAYWYDYAFLYAAVAVMAINTLFSYVWGLLR